MWHSCVFHSSVYKWKNLIKTIYFVFGLKELDHNSRELVSLVPLAASKGTGSWMGMTVPNRA